jgi:hypothetical protein
MKIHSVIFTSLEVAAQFEMMTLIMSTLHIPMACQKAGWMTRPIDPHVMTTRGRSEANSNHKTLVNGYRKSD